MSCRYSSFISYRRNNGDENFVKKFKVILECEGQKVTNKTKAFFDEESIDWGSEFDDKIYDGIVASYFFIPFYHNSYLHEDNLWCAKELYRAIEVEKRVRNAVKTYCFILPIIDRGKASDFPECIGKKNAKEIRAIRHLILNNKTSKALEAFKDTIYDILLSNYKSLCSKDIKFSEICADISIPTDEEIKKWIRVQKKMEKEIEASNLPVLKKCAN